MIALPAYNTLNQHNSAQDLIETIPSNPIPIMRKVLAEKSLKHFIYQAWHIVEPKTPLIWNWHLDAIVQHLEAITNTYIVKSGLAGTESENGQIYEADLELPSINYFLCNIPPRHTKLIADSQLVFTPDGWRKHGDLKIGDRVFGSDGQPTNIISISEDGIADYEIEFSNGQTIKCNGDHLWTVYDRSSRKITTLTTTSMASVKYIQGANSKPRARFLLPVSPACEFSEADLVIDPYFLGLWLGDGTADKPAITHNGKDFVLILEELNRRGIKETKRYDNAVGFGVQSNSVRVEFRRQGIIKSLRQIGVYDNKHIPDIYKRSSIKQRLDLMAGYIDTDGSCDKNGRIRIGTMSKRLANDIYDVALSLGWSPYICENDAMHCPDDAVYYLIGFNPIHDVPIITRRKRPRRKAIVRRYGVMRIARLSKPEKGHCITIANKDGLYLVGEKNILTHNSLIAGVFWPCWEWGPKNLPFLRYICTSYAQPLSTRDSLKRRKIVESRWYREQWGYRFSLASDANLKTRFDNDRTGFMLATSLLGFGLGEGGDRIIADDPNNTIEIESQTKCQRAIDIWDDTYSTRVNDDEVGAYVIIQQRTGVKDISGHLIDKHKHGELPQLVHLCLPARYESDHPHPTNSPLDFKDPRTQDGEVLDGHRWPSEKLEIREKKMTAWAKAGQFQQRPRPKGGLLMEVFRINVVDNYNHRKVKKMVRYWDKAITEDKSASYTVGLLMGLMADDFDDYGVIILDVVRGQLNYGKRDKVMKQTADLDGIEVQHVVEQEPGSGGKESAINSVRKVLFGYKCSPDRPTGDKETRLEPFAGQVDNDNVAVLKGAWNKDYLAGLEDCVPGNVTDYGDASSGAFNWLSGLTGKQRSKVRMSIR